MTTPSHTRRTRVAGTQPGFIGKADALPITHTTSQAGRGQTASTSYGVHQAPHSFPTANHRTAAALVAAMVAVVITMSAFAVAVVLDDIPARSWIVTVTLGGLVAFGMLLTIPAALAARLEMPDECDDDTVVLGDGFWSIDEDTPR